MNLKVLGIITGTMIVVTILLFVFTAGITPEEGEGEVDGTAPGVVVVPTPDPAAPPVEGMARLVGRICISSGINLNNGVMLVAERIPDKEQFKRYISGPMSEETIYALDVEPGRYEIFTESLDGLKLGLYSQYVVCGLDSIKCLDHDMVQVQAREGESVEAIDVCDYQWSR